MPCTRSDVHHLPDAGLLPAAVRPVLDHVDVGEVQDGAHLLLWHGAHLKIGRDGGRGTFHYTRQTEYPARKNIPFSPSLSCLSLLSRHFYPALFFPPFPSFLFHLFHLFHFFSIYPCLLRRGCIQLLPIVYFIHWYFKLSNVTKIISMKRFERVFVECDVSSLQPK